MTNQSGESGPVPPAAGFNSQPAIDARYPVTGDMVGNLRIEGTIASGGMAHVYKGVHVDLEVVRAVKLLKPGFTEENRLRFQTEAKLAANLHHPAIVQIYNVGLWEERLPYIEMEYVPGVSLFDLLTQRGALPLTVALSITRIVCGALAFASHQSFTVYGKSYRGLVHRDIKPANILLHSNGMIKLTDFGIALPEGISLHTTSPGMLGTFPYASPEQLSSLPIDSRTDVYSLGCVLYEMVTGEKAFPQKTLPDLIRCKEDGRYRAPQTLARTMTDPVAELIGRSLMVDREKRYRDADTFALAIEEALAELTQKGPSDLVRNWVENRDDSMGGGKAIVRRKNSVFAGLLPYIFSILALGLPMLGIIWAYNRFFVGTQQPDTAIAGKTAPAVNPIETVIKSSSKPNVSSRKQFDLPVHDDAPSVSAPTVEERMKPAVVPVSASVLLSQGLAAFATRDFGRASRLLRRALDANLAGADSTRAVLRLFESYLETGDTRRAGLIMVPVLNDGYFYVLTGRFWSMNGRTDKADSSYEKAFTVRSVLGNEALDKAAYWKARGLDTICSLRPDIENRRKAVRAWRSYLERVCTAGADGAECDKARARVDDLKVDDETR